MARLVFCHFPAWLNLLCQKWGEIADFGGFESSLAYRLYFPINKTLNFIIKLHKNCITTNNRRNV